MVKSQVNGHDVEFRDNKWAFSKTDKKIDRGIPCKKCGKECDLVKLQKPRELDGGMFVSVDTCISSLVQALNDSGFKTEAACCGHGNRPGRISLEDGREFFIASDYEEATKIDIIFNKAGYKPISGEN